MKTLRIRPGFTMIELLMAAFLAAVGMLTMVALGNVQSQLYTFERDGSVARILANSFLARLRGEAMNFNEDADFSETETPLLLYGLTAGTMTEGGQWVAVPTIAENGSPLFNPLGIPSEEMVGGTNYITGNPDANEDNQRYCIHYKLGFVSEDMAPGELLNAQVRVFYPLRTDSFSPNLGVADCGFADPADMAARTHQFRYVQQTTVLYQHSEI